MTQLLTQVLSKYIPHYGQFAGLHPILHWKIQDVKSVAQQFIREYYSDHNHDMYTNILERRVNPCFLRWFSPSQNDASAEWYTCRWSTFVFGKQEWGLILTLSCDVFNLPYYTEKCFCFDIIMIFFPIFCYLYAFFSRFTQKIRFKCHQMHIVNSYRILIKIVF